MKSSTNRFSTKRGTFPRATIYTYCDCGALDSITDALNNTTSYTYDLNGRVTRIGYPGGSSVTNSYNIFGKLLAVSTRKS